MYHASMKVILLITLILEFSIFCSEIYNPEVNSHLSTNASIYSIENEKNLIA